MKVGDLVSFGSDIGIIVKLLIHAIECDVYWLEEGTVGWVFIEHLEAVS